MNGQQRLQFSQLANLEPGMVCTFRRGDVTWTCETGDALFAELFVYGSFAARDVDAFLGWATAWRPDAHTIIDVGANVGTTTIPAVRAGFRVVAVEPVASTRRLLVRNLVDNNLAGMVHVSPHAVVDQPSGSDAAMLLTVGSGMSEVAGAEPPTWGAGNVLSRQECTTVRLDQLAPHPQRVAAVWADTQGCEVDVVATGPNLWTAGVPLWTEVWPLGLERRPGGVARFVDLVAASFTHWQDADRLAAGDPPVPVDSFPAWVAGLDGRWADCLLVNMEAT